MFWEKALGVNRLKWKSYMNLKWKQGTWLLYRCYFILLYLWINISQDCLGHCTFQAEMIPPINFVISLVAHSFSIIIEHAAKYYTCTDINNFTTSCQVSYKQRQYYLPNYIIFMRHNNSIFSIQVGLKVSLTGGGNSSTHCLRCTMQ